ncbi:LytR/AlgR family response regulator transcription factor [Agaribacterium haliotis]|uniref:LytR/AlgR family response regulator transcription factor n=1 Tax=Agaribacterium haliotis TaxID=2013869 RepID=UPI000BB58610|nr:LytTR family DNA-binding domain-containing protein [Agaribacterium haliotis]
MNTSKIRCIIVDDEPLARRGMRVRLQQYQDLVVIAEAGSGRSALEEINKHQPDLVFLDIAMPGMNGMQLVQQLLKQQQLPAIVFVTAYNDYAIEAFEANALDYLLKPVNEQRLEQCINKLRLDIAKQKLLFENSDFAKNIQQLNLSSFDSTLESISALKSKNSTQEKSISIKDGHVTKRVNTSEIDLVEAAGDYMCVHQHEQTHVVRSTMKALLKQLDGLNFLRIHRSTVVNLEKVSSWNNDSSGELHLQLVSGRSLKVSRSYRDQVRRQLKQL